MLSLLLALIQPPAPLDSAEAARVFELARQVADGDGGRLWGRSLAGPLLIVDPRSGITYASESDPTGRLVAAGPGVWRGRLPPEINPANTAVRYGGRRWTMVVWPLPPDPSQRRQLLGHELWHRIQDSLGLPMHSPISGHLDRESGRIWLRLEARALATALGSRGEERTAALIDALSFRRARTGDSPAADSSESLLERSEGLAEYTGIVVSGRSDSANAAEAIVALRRMEEAPTLARSFAYSTGPAYGLLLDALRPGWRLELRTGASLARLASRAVAVFYRSAAEMPAVEARHGGAAIRAAEAARATRVEARRRELVARLITGPILTLPLSEARFGFDPTRVESLDSLGSVYGGLRLTDAWGVLDATAGVGRIAADFKSATVAVGSGFDPRKPAGEGWTLELGRDWRIVADSAVGRWRVVKAP